MLEIERALAALDRVRKHGRLPVETTEQEILARDFGGNTEPLRIEQRFAGGGFRDRGFELAPIAAPQIGLVGEIEGAAVAVVLERNIDRDTGGQLPGDRVLRPAIARSRSR